jgi:hypothetical protein
VTNASRCRIKARSLSPELAEAGWLVGPINAGARHAGQPALARPDQREPFEGKGRRAISKRWSISDSKKASNFFKDML